MYGDTLAGAFAAMLVCAALIGAAIFAVLFFGIPWLWEMIKPWLHQVTS